MKPASCGWPISPGIKLEPAADELLELKDRQKHGAYADDRRSVQDRDAFQGT
jgi:hypothetical protein